MVCAPVYVEGVGCGSVLYGGRCFALAFYMEGAVSRLCVI